MASPHNVRTLERILWQNPNLKEERERREILRMHSGLIIPPSEFEGGFVSPKAMEEWRKKKGMPCADVVITVRLSDGTSAVVASLRAPDMPFGRFWWMQGGSISGYTPILDFVRDRAEKECGVAVTLEALIGLFYTNAEDFSQSTLQPCFVGSAPFAGLSERLRTDGQHANVHLLTLKDLGQLPEEQMHWYPMNCFHAALTSMPG